MNIKLILICTVLVLFTFVDIGDGKLSRSGGWGTLLRSRSSPRSRSPQPSSNRRQQHNQGGSTPDKIGWNVPDKKPSGGTNTAPKPSAPVLEQSAKTSASNVQSGYNPSAGHGYNPSVGQGYKPPAGQGYNPPVGQGYNPPVGQGYNPPGGQGYNPSIGHGYNPSVGHGYNPSVGQGYHPPVGGQNYNPSVGQGYYPSQGHGYSPLGHAPSPSYGQPSYTAPLGQSLSPGTIYVQQAQKPGIGQLAKEAFVYAGVSAGVNAAVSRLLPGGIFGTRSSSSGGGGGATHTEITYNNYYNNGTAPAPAPAPASNPEQAGAVPGVQPLAGSAAPAAPASPPAAQPAAETPQTSQNNAGTNNAPANNANPQSTPQNNANPHGFIISDADIKKLTESLYEKEKNSALQYITINLQGQKKDDSTSDDAPEPLLTVKDEAYEIPTVKAMLPLYDNYELDVKTPETVTADERKEEMELLDKIFETDVMKTTMKFLADRSGFIPDDEYEFKDTMKRLWFSQFKRIDGGASSSGFETVFLAEQFDSDIIGLHNWIYYAKQEADKKLNYLGYIKEVKLGDKGAILKVRSSLNGIVQPVTTLFVGTSPELEFALYTMCFVLRPNNLCPVSLGGTEFSIAVSGINYFGKDILISGYPDI